MQSGKSSDETIETGYAIQCAKTERLGLCNKLKELKTLTERCALCPTKVVIGYGGVAVCDCRSGFSRDTKTPGSLPGGFVQLESGRFAPDRG